MSGSRFSVQCLGPFSGSTVSVQCLGPVSVSGVFIQFPCAVFLCVLLCMMCIQRCSQQPDQQLHLLAFCCVLQSSRGPTILPLDMERILLLTPRRPHVRSVRDGTGRGTDLITRLQRPHNTVYWGRHRTVIGIGLNVLRCRADMLGTNNGHRLPGTFYTTKTSLHLPPHPSAPHPSNHRLYGCHFLPGNNELLHNW